MDEQFSIIEDVDSTIKGYIKEHIAQAFLFISAPGLLGLYCFYRAGSVGGECILFFLIPSLYFGHVRSKVLRAFMKQYAAANHFTFTDEGSTEGLDGSLFERGDSRSVYSVVSGKYQDIPLKLFYYTYAEGSGKNRRVYRFTVFELEYAGDLPSIIAEKPSVLGWGLARANQEKLKIQPELDAAFAIYVERGYEIEAFEIFTPEVIEVLLKYAGEFRFEFFGKHLYIYANGAISTKKELLRLQDFAQYLHVTLGPRFVQLYDDVQAMKSVRQEASSL